MKKTILTALCIAGMTMSSHDVLAQRIQQPLGRGVVAVKNGGNVLVTWRKMAQEPEDVSYNVYYRTSENESYKKLNASPLGRTNFSTTTSVVTTGGQVAVATVVDGVEQEKSEPFTVIGNNLRGAFVDITFNAKVLSSADYTNKYIWPADLTGDGEYDYIVDRLSNVEGVSDKIEAYTHDGRHLWTVDMGPNVTISRGHNDMVVAYDVDCDGKAEVVIKSSDGTRFWDSEAATWGKYLKGKQDTDGDGIVDYKTQWVRNPPQYITVIDGETGTEQSTIEMPFPSDGSDTYSRTNKSNYMDDDYSKLNGHMGICYLDGIHPSVTMEYMVRDKNKTHHYYISAWGYDFANGTAGEWKEHFTWSRNDKRPWPAEFHHIRVGDVDLDGKDEILDGGFVVDDDGTMLHSAGISHGDRFRVSDINPERPGLETFAIQQNAPDMLGQILYDAGTGEAIKKWYLSSVGDVGRGECMDIDPKHKGYEMWSTMSGVYDCNGDIISELGNGPFPREGMWWDGVLDREYVGAPDGSGHNVYMGKFNGTRLYEIAKGSGWTLSAEYGTRAMFWGDIIGDWREEILLRKNDGSGFVGFSTDYATEVALYCMQENPMYRMQCTNRGYYQTPYPDYYLGYDMARPPLPPCMVADLVWADGGYTDYARTQALPYTDGKRLLFDLSGAEVVNIDETLQPSTIYVMAPKGKHYVWNGTGSTAGAMELWKSQNGVLEVNIPLTHTGTTYISEGTLVVNNRIEGPVELRAKGTLAGTGRINGALSFEDALNYEGCRLSPGNAADAYGTLTLGQSLTVNRRVFYEVNLKTKEEVHCDRIHIEGDFIMTTPLNLRFITAEEQPEPGIYTLLTWTGAYTGDASKVSVMGLKGLSYEIRQEGNSLLLEIKAQRNAAQGVMWTGQASSLWDYQSKNFLLGTDNTEFVAGDEVEFTDEATTTTVTINELMPIGKVTVNNDTKSFTFTGGGGLSGAGSLVKEGKGKLTLATTKSNYTGATIINGGSVVVKELADGGLPSSIGAASSAAENLQIGKATLIIDNSNTATNRGITLTDTATIQVNSGATSLKGQIKGRGMLVKSGAGQLNITYGGANTWSGGTRLMAGTLAMGTWNTTFGTSTSKIEVTGNSTIRVFDNNSTSAVPTINNTIDILKGKTLTIVGGQRCAIRGRLTGEGTLRISFPYVRGDVYTNMSAFQGTYEVTSGQFRLASAIDLSQGTLKLGAGVYAAHVEGGGKNEKVLTSKIGALTSSAADCTLASGIWNVGYLGTNDTYAGIFNSAATINKYGEGTLTLTGTSQGKLNIYEGSVLAGNTSAATTSGATIVYEGGKLAGAGKIAGVTIKRGGILAAGKNNLLTGTLTLTGSLNVNSGGILYVRARNNGRTDAFKADGKVTLMSPCFQIEHIGEGFAEGDELPIFTGAGSINLSGTPTFEPAIPCEGCVWDYSTLEADGIIRVISDGTGIDDAELTTDNSQLTIYDLIGRKIESITEKGIYIINGKKVIR